MKKKVVVVEDDASIRDVLQIILERVGYEVTNYPDGTEIFNGNTDMADVFLIDRQLSGVDGLDVCRFLKKQEATLNIPVIILSATPGIMNLVKDAGADAFIEKPFTKQYLVDTIVSVLEGKL